MFPSADLRGAVEQATKAVSSTPDTLEGVRSAAHRLGVDKGVVNAIYDRYGRTMQARAVCGLLGTTPEAIKADADKILSGVKNAPSGSQNAKAAGLTKFPRLK